jgi:hypothetical protein
MLRDDPREALEKALQARFSKRKDRFWSSERVIFSGLVDESAIALQWA